LAVAVFSFWYYGLGGAATLERSLFGEYAANFVRFVFLIAGLSILYEIGSVVLGSAMLKAGAKEGEVTMILGLIKFAFIAVGIITVITYWFSLGAIGTIFAAFGGMFLGWSLQAPISGLAAWFLVSIIRPFTVGDRVQLPSYGLVGDVVSVTPLYTVLNQVGGSVGSEEPANRTVLIPNAMLFSALLINYTVTLNLLSPKIAAPFAPFLYYQIWEIPIVVAFLLYGSSVGAAISIVNTLLLLAYFPGSLPTGPLYNLAAVLSTLLGLYIVHRFTSEYSSRKRETLIISSSTALGATSRVGVMSVVNWIFLQYPYPIGYNLPLKAVEAMLPIIGLFNATLALYTIPMGYLLAKAVSSGTKTKGWFQKLGKTQQTSQ